MRKIKVVHIVTAYPSVVTILDTKLSRLNAFDDVELSIVSSPQQDDDPRKPAARHIPVYMSRKIRLTMDLKSIFGLCRIFKQEKFDVVHSHTAKAGFVSAMAGKIAKVPLICHTYHGLPFFEGQSAVSYQRYRILEKLACKFRHYVFSQNKRDLTKCAYLIGDNGKALLEGNGVDIDFVRKSAEIQLVEAEKDYPNGEIRLAMISRIEPVKRVTDFIKAVELIRKKGVKVSAVIAGTGIMESEVRKEIKRLRLDDFVNMVGFSNRPHGIIAASDIVVLCSEKEGIPRAVIEAMALKKPVVATDVLGTQEVVSDGDTGYLTPLGDIRSLADRINILIEDPSLREKMGNSGAKRVEHSFNDIKIAEFLHDFYLNRLVS